MASKSAFLQQPLAGAALAPGPASRQRQAGVVRAGAVSGPGVGLAKDYGSSELVDSVFASRYTAASVPKYRLAEEGIPKEAAYQMIHDELLLDSNPRLNLASFVTTWMEPECDRLIAESLNKNYIDIEEYPITNDLQDRCVNVIAHLFNAPLGETERAIGTGCVGSSEAIMLAGLAFKRRWQAQRRAQDKPTDKPNIVFGSEVQVCWEKFANYFEVEMRFVNIKAPSFVMDPADAVAAVDENTICVAGILGSTYTGEFEDIRRLNDLLQEKNRELGLDVGIHVDGASGGFVAPFLYPELEWDFRLPLVRSINVSGHKFGLVYPGVGWVVWRSKEYLPEDLIFHVNYLGADQPTFTLNFSKGAGQLIAQYYQFLRLGFEGYKRIISNCDKNAKYLRSQILELGLFDIYSAEVGVPLVTFGLKDRGKFDEYHIADHLRQYGWVVPAYTMAPDRGDVTMLRVLVREDFSRALGDRFLADLAQTLQYLEEHPPPPHKAPVTASAATPPLQGQAKDLHPLDPHALASRVFRVFKKNTADKTTGVC